MAAPDILVPHGISLEAVQPSRPVNAALGGRRGPRQWDLWERRLRRRVLEPLDATLGAAVRSAVNRDRSYRPIFVSGAMGGGTTLLALSLWQRFDLAAAIKESVHQVSTRSFLWRPGAHEFGSVADYDGSIRPRDDWSVERGRRDLLRMYRSYAWGRSDVVVDKGPNANLVRAGFLARCFPEARFVLIFRDPVATIEGFRRKWRAFGNAPLDESIDFYERIHEAFLEAMWDFPERVLAVAYERLVEKHDELMDTVGRDLDLVPARRVRRLEHRSNRRGCGIRNVHHGRIQIVEDANRGSYERMSASEVKRIQRRLGPLHARMSLMSI
jgi:Sulfotransferase family